MTLLVPNVGEVVLLTNLLAGGSLENWTLKLFKSNSTPAESDVAGTYTEADFTGYSAKTLTRSVSGSTWATPATGDGNTTSQYDAASPQSWTNTGASAETVYGYYIVGATSGILLVSEAFAASRTLNQNDVLNLTPQLQLI